MGIVGAAAWPRWAGSSPPTCPGRAAGLGEMVTGGRWGASGRRYRAISSDVERLKLLVELPGATPSHGLDLHGIQDNCRHR
jgi:hypothetical protein